MSGSSTALPCGADLGALVRQAFDGTPPADPEHQRTCPHCRAALGRVRALVDDVRGAAAEPVSAPPGLLTSVMARLRSAPALVTVDVHARGTTSVADEVIAEVARRAALAVDGVDYASVVAADPSPTGTVGLRVRLVVTYGVPLPGLADAVRAAMTRATTELTGAALRAVDVRIDDLA